LNDEDLTLPLW